MDGERSALAEGRPMMTIGDYLKRRTLAAQLAESPPITSTTPNTTSDTPPLSVSGTPTPAPAPIEFTPEMWRAYCRRRGAPTK